MTPHTSFDVIFGANCKNFDEKESEKFRIDAHIREIICAMKYLKAIKNLL
jgi:hypothetical protein